MPVAHETTDHRDEPIVINATNARQGDTPGVMRWVLAVSLVLVVIAFTVVALTSG